MIIGIPKEIKKHEYRIGLTPDAAKILAKNGQLLSIESGAGIGAGFFDNDFKNDALITNQKFVWLSEMIVKVKEPLKEECELMKPEQIIFAFFHFPANPELKKIVIEKQIRALPYENIQLPDGSRPVLKVMSKIAAEVSVDAAIHYLKKENGGKGVPFKDSKALVIGCEGALGKTAFNLLKERIKHVYGFDLPTKIKTEITAENNYLKFSRPDYIEYFLSQSDFVICAAARKGEGAPKLITRQMLKSMQAGSIIIDPSIDEGGCCETSRPTTHDNPVYIEEGIIHYCVANMPGAIDYAQLSTIALVNETLPYILEVADKGLEKALKENPILAQAAKIN
jgi:alanine dehydrogenase